MSDLLARLRAWLLWPVDPLAVAWREQFHAGIEAELLADALQPHRVACVARCPQFAVYDLIVGPVCSFHERVARTAPQLFAARLEVR